MNDVLIRFRLVGQQAEALTRWAASKLRSPADQVRFVLMTELERRGLLSPDVSISPGSDETERGSNHEGN